MGAGEDEGESPRFDMPWHVATLKILLEGFDLSYPWFFRIEYNLNYLFELKES
jgi:hypothetical protein